MIYALRIFAVCVPFLVIEMERNIYRNINGKKSALLAWGSLKSLDISINTLNRLKFCLTLRRNQAINPVNLERIPKFHFSAIYGFAIYSYEYSVNTLTYDSIICSLLLLHNRPGSVNDILLPKGPPFCSGGPPTPY